MMVILKQVHLISMTEEFLLSDGWADSFLDGSGLLRRGVGSKDVIRCGIGELLGGLFLVLFCAKHNCCSYFIGRKDCDITILLK